MLIKSFHYLLFLPIIAFIGLPGVRADSRESALGDNPYHWEGWNLFTDSVRQPIRAAIEEHHPPFTVRDPHGQADGFAVELLRAALAAMGRDVRFVIDERTAIEQGLTEGYFQVLPFFSRTHAYENQFDFSVPYLRLPGVIITRPNEEWIQGPADLRGKKILVADGDVAVDYLTRHGLAENLVPVASAAEALTQLAGGIGDAAVIQKLTAHKFLEKTGIKLRIVGTPLTDFQELCFAVHNGDKKLLALLNDGLARVTADGTFDRLQHRWLNTLPAYHYPLQSFFAMALAMFILWIMVKGWQGTIQRRIKTHTAGLTAANRHLAQEMVERRYTEDALRRYAADMTDLYDHAPVGYHSLDANGIFIRINDTELEWLGYTRDDLLWRKHFQDVLTPDSVLIFQRILSEITKHRRVVGLEFDMVRKDGSLLPVLFSATIVQGDNGSYLLNRCTVYDITERRRTEIALRQREAELREAQRLAKVGSWEWNPQTDAIYWSDERYRIAGLSPEKSLQRQNLEQFYSRDSLEKLFTLMHECIETGNPYELEVETLQPSGVNGWVHIRGEARRDSHGIIVGLRGTVQDITDRKRAEMEIVRHREHLESLIAERTAELRESELRYRTVAEFTADWETWRGTDGHYLYVSPATEQITGYPAGAFLENPDLLEQIIHPDDRDQVINHFRNQKAHPEPIVMEFRILRADCQLAWIEHICRTVYDDAGNYAGSRASNRDITKRKRAEEALRDADRRKDQFLAILGHELRNPLAPIRNAAELLHQGASLTPDQVRWAADLLGRQVSHISRLVDDLLDVSRITRGKVQLQRLPVDLTEIATRALEQTRPLMEDARHRLHTHFPTQPLTVEADPVRMLQVIGNLLTNSAKYTDPGGTIWLTVTEEAGQAVIRVRDNGIGIPVDLLPRVFEMFVQAEQGLDRARGGLGLGLTLVKSLVEMHNGQVEAQSPGRGQGSTFTVRLPLWRATGSLPAPAPTTTAVMPARTVLVVDDNPDVAESFALLLELWGHKVHVVYNGEAALEDCARLCPDIVFLDIGLPGIDGYETARRLRSTEAGKKIYLVAVTGYGQEEDILQAKAAGFDAHLLKPVVPESLEACLTRDP